LAQIFSICLTTLIPVGNLAGSPVVMDQVGVKYGNIRGALFEIGHRKTARHHDFLNQAVGFAHRFSRLVDKLGLYRFPGVIETLPFIFTERAQVERLNPLTARLQFFFGFLLVADLSDRIIVFLSKSLAQFPASALRAEVPASAQP
jgi:hypothetical protein